MTRVLAIIQARMSSQRLPGKVLLPLPSATYPDLRVLDWVFRRTRAASLIDDVVVATSTDLRDDPLAEYCHAAGYSVHRGSLSDVLGRFVTALEAHPADVVVRLTGDCPLVDPVIIDSVVRAHLSTASDFTANRLPPPHTRSFPIGLDVEVVNGVGLTMLDQVVSDRAQREHVLPYLYENPERFKITVLNSERDAGDVRWTVDTPEDLVAVSHLVTLANANLSTTWAELLDAWYSYPHLAQINSAVRQRSATETDPQVTDEP